MELKINTNGKHVVIVQSTGPPTNDNLIELLLMISAARRDNAKFVTVVIPYFGYGRQDQNKDDSGSAYLHGGSSGDSGANGGSGSGGGGGGGGGAGAGGGGGGADGDCFSPISAADVVEMISVSGVDRVITLDLHSPQVKANQNQTLLLRLQRGGVAACGRTVWWW